MGDGEGGMTWENDIETCILSYVKRISGPGLMYETGCSRQCTGMTQRDGMLGEGEWNGVQDEEHMYTSGRSTSMYGKTTKIL